MKLKCIQPGKDGGWDIVDATGKVVYSDPDRELVKVKWQYLLADVEMKEASDGTKPPTDTP